MSYFLDGKQVYARLMAPDGTPLQHTAGILDVGITGTVSLPTGAATEATLASLDGKVTAVNTGAVVVSSSALPAGAATETTLGILDAKVTACDTGNVTVVSTALPTGASTEATLAALSAKVTACDTANVTGPVVETEHNAYSAADMVAATGSTAIEVRYQTQCDVYGNWGTVVAGPGTCEVQFSNNATGASGWYDSNYSMTIVTGEDFHAGFPCAARWVRLLPDKASNGTDTFATVCAK